MSRKDYRKYWVKNMPDKHVCTGCVFYHKGRGIDWEEAECSSPPGIEFDCFEWRDNKSVIFKLIRKGIKPE